jgi:hypothetical protein
VHRTAQLTHTRLELLPLATQLLEPSLLRPKAGLGRLLRLHCSPEREH